MGLLGLVATWAEECGVGVDVRDEGAFEGLECDAAGRLGSVLSDAGGLGGGFVGGFGLFRRVAV